jgi:hypothetical protein
LGLGSYRPIFFDLLDPIIADHSHHDILMQMNDQELEELREYKRKMEDAKKRFFES